MVCYAPSLMSPALRRLSPFVKKTPDKCGGKWEIPTKNTSNRKVTPQSRAPAA